MTDYSGREKEEWYRVKGDCTIIVGWPEVGLYILVVGGQDRIALFY
jgi:hypothetical protein